MVWARRDVYRRKESLGGLGGWLRLFHGWNQVEMCDSEAAADTSYFLITCDEYRRVHGIVCLSLHSLFLRS